MSKFFCIQTWRITVINSEHIDVIMWTLLYFDIPYNKIIVLKVCFYCHFHINHILVSYAIHFINQNLKIRFIFTSQCIFHI